MEKINNTSNNSNDIHSPNQAHQYTQNKQEFKITNHTEKDLNNEKFNLYYKENLKQYFQNDKSNLNLNDTKEENFNEEAFKLFLEKMKTKLPCVFRINKANPFVNGNFYNLISNKEKINDTFKLTDFNVDLDNIKLCSNSELVYNINLPRVELKKNLKLKELHKFIHSSVEAGLISRQEAVSMVPPFILNIKKSDKVLDLCAAPGSKTGQFLETKYENTDYSKNEDNGFVISNDNSVTRAYMMTHQLQRFNTADLLVTAHDAKTIPALFKNFTDDDSTCSNFTPCNERIKFDKILADVPCSSDAVMRKLPHKWKTWTPKDGFSLHKLQLDILKKGISLLRIGGEIVYSTCSLNPVENEAVIAEVLRLYPNEIEVVDCSSSFDDTSIIKVREGLTDWKLYIENPENKEELVEVKDIESPMYKKHCQSISESCFNRLDNKQKIELKKCIRILPHDSDTSGFFITLLRKKQVVEVNTEKSNDKDTTQNKEAFDIKIKGGVVLHNYGINLLSMEKHSEELTWLRDYYGLKEDFPFHQLASHSDKTSKINYISKGVYRYLKNDVRQQVKIITCGVRVFSQTRGTFNSINECRYRLCQDGILYALPYVTKRVYEVNEETFKTLLTQGSLKLEEFENRLNNKQLKEDLEKLSIGCIVLYLAKKSNSSSDNKTKIEILKENNSFDKKYAEGKLIEDALCCYLSKCSVTHQISKEFRHMFSIKYGVEVMSFAMDDEAKNQKKNENKDKDNMDI